MEERDSGLLSTGEVARLCGVSRDAVLKWIKKGKLPAIQTPGGHYRVPREACQDLGVEGSDSVLEVSKGAKRLTIDASGGEASPLLCWEYFGSNGSPKEVCRNCLVYLARAQNCYRLAELGEESGHQLHFCRNDCRTCAYYRACQGLATEVLIITRDEGLARRIEKGADSSQVSIRFARSGYETSAIISTFSPALILLDGELEEVRTGVLSEAIQNDQRIPAARVVIVCGEDDAGSYEHLPVLTVQRPVTAKQVEKLVGEVARPYVMAPRDVA